MQLIYYRGRTPNFGDDLNKDVWPALAPDLFDGDGQHGFVGIGSIIGMEVAAGPRLLHVVGSGAGYNALRQWQGRAVRYWCVRGPLSARIIGGTADLAITDGAILTPLTPGFPAAAIGGGGVVIIPHWETLDHPGWDAVAQQTGFDLIDPRGEPLHVIQQIARARLVLTESLHGAIIADAYGIPWIAFATSNNFAFVKWADWTLSHGMNCRVTMVPPPSPGPIFTHFRPPTPFGQTMTVDIDDAIRAFEQRYAPPAPAAAPGLRLRARAKVQRLPWLHPLLGFNPRRTADALLKLAKHDPDISRDSVRSELRERFMDRLTMLRVQYRQGFMADAA
jgi:succinoglycan biosynthesis protein ExoV